MSAWGDVSWLDRVLIVGSLVLMFVVAVVQQWRTERRDLRDLRRNEQRFHGPRSLR